MWGCDAEGEGGRLASPDVPGRHFCDHGLCKEGLYGKEIYRRVNLYILRQAGRQLCMPLRTIKTNIKACLEISTGNLCPVQVQQGNAPLHPGSQ
jgi:hypothetical protein